MLSKITTGVLLTGLVGGLGAAAPAAGTKLTERVLRTALGLGASTRLTKTAVAQQLRQLKRRKGHILFDQRGRALTPPKRGTIAARRRAARRGRRRAKRQPPNPQQLLARMGRVLGGRISRAGFRLGKLAYRHLDVTGRGYVTTQDLAKAIAPGGRFRYKASRFVKKYDRNRDWRLSRRELAISSRRFAALDTNRDQHVDLDEVTAFLTRRRAQRDRKRSRQKK